MPCLRSPPKLYLDTGHLISISKLRRGAKLPSQFTAAYARLDDCIRKHHFGLILNWHAPIEWTDGGASAESACEIAAVVDSAQLLYLFEGDVEVYTAEILRAISRKHPHLLAPDLPIFQWTYPGAKIPTALGPLAQNVPGYIDPSMWPAGITAADIPTIIVHHSARELARHAAHRRHIRNASLVPFEEREIGYYEALNHDIANAHLLPATKQQFFIEWMKRFLKVDLILSAYNPSADIESILQKFDINLCPAVQLYFNAREKRIRAKYKAPKNEVDDWLFLPVVPYADLVLTDRGFRTMVLQADPRLEKKIVSDPNEACGIIAEWMTPTASD